MDEGSQPNTAHRTTKPELDAKTAKRVDELTDDAFNKVFPALMSTFSAILSESDRGSVLVGAAWIEDMLGEAVDSVLSSADRAKGTDDKEGKQKNIDSLLAGVLEKGRNRVSFCRAVGMIDAAMEKAVISLLELRNKHFAHFSGMVQLDDPAVAQRLANFVKAAPKPAADRETLTIEPFRSTHSQQRVDFTESLGHLAEELMEQRLLFITGHRPNLPYESQPPQ